MNSFEYALNEVKNELQSLDCVKDYFYYKKIISNDIYLKNLYDRMKNYQKEMCKNKNNEELFKTNKEEFEKLKNEFEKNPILINYQITKEEVDSVLVDIKDILG